MTIFMVFSLLNIIINIIVNIIFISIDIVIIIVVIVSLSSYDNLSDYDQIYFALQDIFPNKTHLPSFNSAAIESHLFRIPNLSSRFLYMCDDFMFGSNVTMDDFYTKRDGYKVIIIKGEVTYLNEIYIGGKMASTKYMLTVILLSRDIYWW